MSDAAFAVYIDRNFPSAGAAARKLPPLVTFVSPVAARLETLHGQFAGIDSLPFLGLSLAAATGAVALGTAVGRPALGWALLAAFGLANLLALQERHLEWRSFASLATADADRLPGNSLLESIAALSDFKRHDAAGALQRAERAVRSDPGNSLALQVAGLALDRLGQPVEAEQALARAFEASGQSQFVTEDYVRFLIRHKRPADARAVLRRARAAPPNVRLCAQFDAMIEALER